MGKILDIALKDLVQGFRNAFTWVMMFVAPLLITGLIYFAFSGLAGDEQTYNLPTTRVQVVNLDRAVEEGVSFSAGQMLVDFLQDESLAGFLDVSAVDDAARARADVDAQRAGVAVIIPADMSAAVFTPAEEATIELYADPTLTLGPSIVREMVGQFTDGFVGAKIATTVVREQLATHGARSPEAVEDAALAYAAWVQARGAQRSAGAHPAVEIRGPRGTPPAESALTSLAGPIMAGMLVFFAFYTGAQTASTIIREDEEGTLARLFTTPTPLSVLLGGKFAAVFLTLAVQVVVLLLASGLLFGIRWGRPLTVALVGLGQLVSAAGFGVLLMSFIKSSRQTGPVLGGVLTLMGMLGGLFTTGVPNLPPAFNALSRLTPHGWALDGWELALRGARAAEVLLPVGVMVGVGLACFAIGVLLFRKRFA
jgi:ABC-2 type transport system permease protein